MHAAPVVFCERMGNWAAAWRRLESRRVSPGLARSQGTFSDSCGRTSRRLIETRSAPECRQMVAANRGTFVVVELEAARVDQALDLLFELASRFADTASAVVANRDLLGHEWLARELGAQAFVVSLLDLECLYELAQRHTGRASGGRADITPRDLREEIWNNLPWGAT